MARKNVVIIKDLKGNTLFVAFPKSLEENDIGKALNECSKYHQKEETHKKELESKIKELECSVSILNLDIKLDRGEITQEEYDEEISKYGK